MQIIDYGRVLIDRFSLSLSLCLSVSVSVSVSVSLSLSLSLSFRVVCFHSWLVLIPVVAGLCVYVHAVFSERSLGDNDTMVAVLVEVKSKLYDYHNICIYLRMSAVLC